MGQEVLGAQQGLVAGCEGSQREIESGEKMVWTMLKRQGRVKTWQ
jgi:hypothetical protein